MRSQTCRLPPATRLLVIFKMDSYLRDPGISTSFGVPDPLMSQVPWKYAPSSIRSTGA